MRIETYTPRYREPVVLDVPEDATEAAAPVACPVFRCTLAGRGCAARHLSGVAGHPSHGACAACPGGQARAALLDVRAPTPAEVLRQMTHPGPAPVFEERYMSDATDKILAHLGHGPASAGDIRRATGLGDSVVKAAVQTLKGRGRVVLEGHGKAARWSLAPAPVASTPPAVDLPPAVDVVPVVEEQVPGGVEVDVLVTRRAPAVPQAVVDAAFHPTGRCVCAGEGACEWCQGVEQCTVARARTVAPGVVNLDVRRVPVRRCVVGAVDEALAAVRREAEEVRTQRDEARAHAEDFLAQAEQARREAESAKGLQAEAEREAAEWRKKAEAAQAGTEQAKRIAHGAAVAVGTIVEALQAVGVDPYNADEQAGDHRMVDPEDLAAHIKAEVARLVLQGRNETHDYISKAFRDALRLPESTPLTKVLDAARVVASLARGETWPAAAAVACGVDIGIAADDFGQHPLQAARERLAVVEAELAQAKRELAAAHAAGERTSEALWDLKRKLQARADAARLAADAADEALNDVLAIPDPDTQVPF